MYDVSDGDNEEQDSVTIALAVQYCARVQQKGWPEAGGEEGRLLF